MSPPGSADLFALAAANGAALEERLEDLLADASDEDARNLRLFASEVEEKGRVGVNLKLPSLLKLLQDGRLPTAYELAEQDARESGRDAEEHVRKRLDEWYVKRTGFEDRFVEGRRFRYGALNIGGLGPTQPYGNCCAVTSERFLKERELAFLAANSLESFVDDRGRADMARVETSLADVEHRHHLAACKHAGDGERLAGESWPEILCFGDDFVEAIFVGSATVADLRLVRFPLEEYDDIQELSLRKEARETLEEEEEDLTAHFDELKTRLKGAGIALELVDAH
ncbi:MAG: hypothetical protein GY719_01020 [bacterium]|nr:hypothetical protein [bacterium]